MRWPAGTKRVQAWRNDACPPLASCNPRRDLAGPRRRGPRSEPRRSDRAGSRDSARHPQRAACRAAARLSGLERARPARAVRLHPPGEVRGADGGRAQPRGGTRSAGERSRGGRGARGHRGALAGRARQPRLARARRGVDLERDAAPDRLGLGAAGRRAARSARARRADALLAARSSGTKPASGRRRERSASILSKRGPRSTG